MSRDDDRSRGRTVARLDPFAKIPLETLPILEAARETVKAIAPRAEEIACDSRRPRSASMLWKLVRYAVDGEVVVTLGTFTKHANMFFARGAEIEDEHGILQGSGKLLRYITLRTPADATSAAVKGVLRKAFRIRERP